MSLSDLDESHLEVYRSINEDEEKVVKELQSLMSRHCHLEAKIKGIVKVLPNLEIIHSDAKQLSEMIGFASTLAENVSYKVRKLDTARSRVSECQQRVHDLLDLQLCCDGVKMSMDAGDFEKAAAHVHRYLSMDQRALEKTADDVNQDSAIVNNSITLLQEAASKLREILKVKFNQAVTSEDIASVERFFKLFPLLGMHDEGLERFSSFLSIKIRVSAKQNLQKALETGAGDKRAGVIFADAITLLFEDIARTIEVHQPIVETYYGPWSLLKVMTCLQDECDVQSKAILTEFRRQRQIKRLTNSITERSRSHAQTRIDPKDLDQLLGELTMIQSRYNLYLRFLRRKVSGETLVQDDAQKAAVQALDEKLSSSELCRFMQELLSYYLLMEHFYMEESVRKAIAMDTVDTGSQISCMIDDVFFIVKKCIKRASGTGNIDGVCAVINNACGVLETEMCSTVANCLRQGFPSGYLDLSQAYNVMLQGRLQTTDSEQAKTIFIAHLNNTEVGTEYVNTLCTSLISEVGCSTELERRKLESCLSGLSEVTVAMGMAQKQGLEQLRLTVVKPRVVTWLDSFLGLSHILTEDEFSSYEANEPFIRSLIGNIDSLLSNFKTTLTPNNYESVVSILATELNAQFEKVVLKTEFNRYGGLALDKEVRALISYLSTATSWSVRDKLARISQVATILNLEHVSEITDYWNSSSLPWKLTPSDVKKFLKLRIDFSGDEINKLKL